MIVESVDNPGLHALVLAAGASTRLGEPKQLIEYRGRTLVEHTLMQAVSVCGTRVQVVLGAHRSRIEPLLREHAVTAVVNESWRSGMASSLKAGLRDLPASCRAVLILLCDQPLVDSGALRRMACAWRADPDRVVAGSYEHTVGVPAIFPARLFPALAALEGDRGAKAVIDEEGAMVIGIDLPEAAFDIDDAHAVQALERLQ